MFTFRLSRFFAPSVLSLLLASGCTTTAPITDTEAVNTTTSQTQAEVVKNYTSIACSTSTSSDINTIEKNIASIATAYFMFRDAAKQPTNAQVKLSGQYATGSSEISSNAFLPNFRDRLLMEDINIPQTIKIISLLELDQKVETKQSLYFSAPCQVNQAGLDNPVLQTLTPVRAVYLMVTKQGFTVMQDRGSFPKQMLIKITLFNPQSRQVEEAVFDCTSIISPFKQSPSAEIKQISKGTENSQEVWRLNRNTGINRKEVYNFYSVGKEARGGGVIRGQIQSIEFVLEEKE